MASGESSQDQGETEESGQNTSNHSFEEDNTYTPCELLNTELEPSEQLSLTAERTFGVVYGDKYVTFEVDKFVCTDVTDIDEISNVGGHEDG